MSQSSRREPKIYILDIHNMTCASCAAKIESVFEKDPSVQDVDVNFALSRAVITTTRLSDDIIAEIHKMGYDAKPIDQKPKPHLKKGKYDTFKMLLSFLLSVPFLVDMAGMALDVHIAFPGWVQFILASIIQFIFGASFYKSALNALKFRLWNMDFLVAFGTTAAWGLSTYIWLFDPSRMLHFEASALIITFVLIGRWLEARSQRSTHKALTTLKHLRPDTARVIRHGASINLPVEEITLEDTVLVRPGERVPCDGFVTGGESQVDTSLLTGEGIPLDKTAGQRITGGVLNLTGVLNIRVTRLPQDSRLQKIIEYVADASASKPPVQRMVDRASRLFTPAIMCISLVTFFAWGLAGSEIDDALLHAITVLVIACPCALGLAAPTVMIVGTGIAASLGILTKNPAVIELFQNVTTVVFDKTGTLTRGRPDVTDFESFDLKEEKLLQFTASLQQHSQHPIAIGVMRYAREKKLDLVEPEEFKAIHGRGITGLLENKRYYMGSRQLMMEKSIDTFEHHQDFDRLAQQAKTVFWISTETELLGLLAVQDAIRHSALDAIETLKAQNMKIIMLTGDSALSAKSVGSHLGIETVIADMTPEKKAETIRSLQATGEVVAMVGDGVNDAPALALADISIAMGGGTDVAKDSSSFSLMRDDPRLVSLLLMLGKKMSRTIKQNLFWAFFYNALCVPLAAFGYVSPAVAGAAMAMSDICVISNALLLKWRVRRLTAAKTTH